MRTLDEVLLEVGMPLQRETVEAFIEHDWIRPSGASGSWHFEEVDVARLRLVCHLTQEIEVNEQGVDIALSLLDQLYNLRTHVTQLTRVIHRQSPDVQNAILAMLREPEPED